MPFYRKSYATIIVGCLNLKTKIVFSQKSLGYGAWHIEGPTRISSAYGFLEQEGYEFKEPFPASEAEILKAHTEKYVLKLKHGEVEDSDTPAYKGIYDYATLAVGGAILASEIGGFALIRPPGHHTGKDGKALGAPTQGFCYLNNIAIAVKAFNKKTLIIDIDGHHGNGTQEIFQDNPKVTYLSLHRHPYYPWTGETAVGNSLNYSLPIDCGEKVYLKTLNQALSTLELSKFEAVAVSAGFDTHQDDLASLGLTEKSYWQIGKTIAALQKPTFFVLEGGYLTNKIGIDIDMLLRGFDENRK